MSFPRQGYLGGVEPPPSGSQPAVQKPLHHRHHIYSQHSGRGGNRTRKADHCAQPASNRLPSSIGWPFRFFSVSNTPTRTRTRNPSLGPRRDFPFTTGTCFVLTDPAEGKGFEPSSRRARTALAERPGQPYPATFRSCYSSGPTENRTRISRLPAWRRPVGP
jgi:hypothetical protein